MQDAPRNRFLRYQLVFLAGSTAMVVGNELAQRAVVRGWIEKLWIFGYASDLFAVPFTTTLVAVIKGEKSRFLELCAPLFGVMYTLLELEGTRDPLDVVCYWVGAGMAWAMVRFAPD